MEPSPVITTVHRLTSGDGYQADFVVYSPQEKEISEATPIIIVHPALGVAGSYYYRFGEDLSQKYRWIVAVQEMRGQGSSSWKASPEVNWSYWTEVEYDFDLQLSVLKKQYPRNPIFPLGHSAGGIMWTLWMAKKVYEKREDHLSWIRAYITVASGSVYYRFHPSKAVYWYALKVASIAYAMGWFPGTQNGFGNEREAKDFMLDWCHNILFGYWQPRGCPIPNISQVYRWIPKAALYVSIDDDPFTPPTSAIEMSKFYGQDKVQFVTLVAKEEPALKNIDGPSLHVRWARTDVVFPHVYAFVMKELANPSKITVPSPIYNTAKL